MICHTERGRSPFTFRHCGLMFAPVTGLSELFVTARFSDQTGCTLSGLLFSSPQQMSTAKPVEHNQIICFLYGCLYLFTQLHWHLTAEVHCHIAFATGLIKSEFNGCPAGWEKALLWICHSSYKDYKRRFTLYSQCFLTAEFTAVIHVGRNRFPEALFIAWA